MKEISLKARVLRQNMTSQEIKLWQILKGRNVCNLQFRRQHPIGNYIVDFVCKEKRLIIEIDGGQHNELNNIEYDKIRTRFLESKGYNVIRFWNNEIDNNIEGIYCKIKDFIEPPTP